MLFRSNCLPTLLSTFCAFVISRLVIHLRKLNQLLLKRDSDEWAKFARSRFYLRKCLSPLCLWRFSSCDEDFGDKELLRLRIIVTNSLISTVTGIVALGFLTVTNFDHCVLEKTGVTVCAVYVLLPFAGLWVISAFGLVFFLFKLDRLICERHAGEWKEFAAAGFGKKCYNLFRSWPFFLCAADFGDAKVLRLKMVINRSIAMLAMLTIVLALIVCG